MIQYASLDKKLKRSCKKDKKASIEKKETEAEKAAKKNDSKTLFKIFKELTGVNSNNKVPIKDKHGKVLSSEEEQNHRWIEHFREVLNQPDPPSFLNFDSYEVMQPLEVNTDEIRIREVLKAIKTLKNNKVPGIDNITPGKRLKTKVLKQGGPDIVQEVCHLFNIIWHSGTVHLQIPVLEFQLLYNKL